MLKFYRGLPAFKGKSNLGRLLFKKSIGRKTPIEFRAHKGITYKIPNTNSGLSVELFIVGIYERKVIAFLNKRIKDGDNYFDIGANIGAMGLPIVKGRPSIKYFGFEASPFIFEYLSFNFKTNGIRNYQLLNYAVHDSSMMAVKFYQAMNNEKSSLTSTFTNEFILVESISLDVYYTTHEITKINWLKVDVQGFELSVFKGATRLLSAKKIENILFEFESWEESAAGFEIGAAQKYLLEMGYELFEISGKRLTQLVTGKRTIIWAKPQQE
ncbi:MAG: FkbM family methyltransferase [Ferruginibacter sp.]